MRPRHRRHDDDDDDSGDPIGDLTAEHVKAYGPKSGYVFVPPAPLPTSPPGKALSGTAQEPASARSTPKATPVPPEPAPAPVAPPRSRPVLAYSRPVWTPRLVP